MQKLKWTFLTCQLVATLGFSTAVSAEPPPNAINATVLPLVTGNTALMLEHDNLLLSGHGIPVGDYVEIILSSSPIDPPGGKSSIGDYGTKEGSAGTGEAWGYAELLDQCGYHDIAVYQYVDTSTVFILSGVILDPSEQCP